MHGLGSTIAVLSADNRYHFQPVPRSIRKTCAGSTRPRRRCRCRTRSSLPQCCCSVHRGRAALRWAALGPPAQSSTLRALTRRTRRLYSVLLVEYSLAASTFAGLFTLGSVSSDWMEVRMVEMLCTGLHLS